MTEAAPSAMLGAIPEPQLDADGCLTDEFACRRCGYALRGLRPSGACPECETPVARSIKGDLLCFSDPDWVQRIALGGQVIAISIVLWIAWPLFMLWIGRVSSSLAFSAGLALPKAVQMIGFWLATTPDPASREHERALSARAIARYGALAAGSLSIAAHIAGLRAPSSLARLVSGQSIQSASLQAVATIVIAGIMIGSIIALLMYARSLALRLPDEKLWKQCKGVAVGVAISLGGLAVVDTWNALAASPVSLTRRGSPFGSPGGIFVIAVMLTMYWCVALIFKFRTRLNDAARLARETWSRPLLSSHPVLGNAHDK